MIHGHQDLLGIEPELHGNGFQHVNRGAIDIGLAGFAQAPVAYRQAMAGQEGGERGWTAIHGGGLDDLRDEQVAPGS